MAKLYASDLAKDKQTDAFMGKGFEEALAKAEAKEVNLIIGEFYDSGRRTKMEPSINVRYSRAGFEITRVMFVPAQERDYEAWQDEVNINEFIDSEEPKDL